ncbi:hypothetical protein MRB53_003010 [Persea americana]|uniref:Uncharacterized protein n=1 Tax=Persea americana TaxID=3435 RepID=A0ACC2MW46_PERAE|nr:hypothetical protein MRB53_003010 [Persea americana]
MRLFSISSAQNICTVLISGSLLAMDFRTLILLLLLQAHILPSIQEDPASRDLFESVTKIDSSRHILTPLSKAVSSASRAELATVANAKACIRTPR